MTVKRASRVSAWSMLGRALRRRCPRCGGRGIFENYFNMKEHCLTCGLALDRGESEDYWLGAYAINLVVGETAAVVGTMIYIFATWPATPFAVWVGIALAVFMPVAFYPFSRTLWLAWDLSFRPTEPGDDLREI